MIVIIIVFDFPGFRDANNGFMITKFAFKYLAQVTKKSFELCIRKTLARWFSRNQNNFNRNQES